MRFGAVPVADAQGAILAHSINDQGIRLKKGRVLGAADIAALAGIGLATVVVAQPDPDDVLEDEAARRIAACLAPGSGNISVSTPFTGRANLYAECPGVLGVDAQRVHRLNEIDEAITLATLPAYTRVAARQMIGTVKIIPYGASGASVARAEDLLRGTGTMAVHPVALGTVHLVLTVTKGMKPTLVRKGAEAVQKRLAALGLDPAFESVIDHDAAALAAALTRGPADLTLILTGSATSDRGDIGPDGVRRAGGTLERFGMPVDPGNLLFLANLNGHPVVGLPGCIRSPKLNGADWVLERLVCGLPVTGADISAMGVGGLLKEISSRPEPRIGGASAPLRPRVAGLLLAAGASSRMRGRDKLLEPLGGKPILAALTERMLESSLDEVYCVVRSDDPARMAAAPGKGETVVISPRASDGMAHSIASGIAALPENIDAAMVLLGDMPEVTAAHLDAMIAAFDPNEGRAIVRGVTGDGQAGHPVLFGRRFFETLAALQGDRGARSIIAEHPEFVVDVPLDGVAALTDLDTPEAWEAWRASAAGSDQ